MFGGGFALYKYYDQRKIDLRQKSQALVKEAVETVLMPDPRHGKAFLGAQVFAVYQLGRFPEYREEILAILKSHKETYESKTEFAPLETAINTVISRLE